MNNLSPDIEQVKRHFDLFFSDCEGQISICTKGPRGLISKFFRPQSKAVLSAVARLAQQGDVWFSVCSYGHRPNSGRGSESDVSLVPALWLDVDCSEGQHKKKGLPSFDEALQFIKSLPWSPSLIIHSGGGFHVYYLFKEAQVIESEDDRASLKSLSERFQKYVIARMKEKGWTCDSTYDLTRIFRPAGTLNHKTDPPVPVRILEESNARYERDDFGQYLPQGTTQEVAQDTAEEPIGAFNVSNLPFSIRELIRNGTEPGRRSEATASVIVALVKAGAGQSEIIRLFETNPQGIGAKYYEKGQGRVKWLQGEISRCRDFANQPQEWPDPKPLEMDLPPVMSLLDEMIPRPFFPLVMDEAHRMSVPPEYIVAPLIVVCGSIIGTGCRIMPKRRDDWAVVPNLWGGVVGPPSRLKTPAMDVAVKKLLGRLEAEAAEEHRKEMLEWTNEKRKCELSKSVLEQEFKAALKKQRK